MINNVMKRYFLYVDESGIANLLDMSYKHFLLTGVIISAEESDNIDGYFNFIKRKYGLSTEEPFHSFEILEDDTSGIKLKPSAAKTFLASVTELIKIAPIRVKVIHSKKKSFRKMDGLKTEENFKYSKYNKKKADIIYTLSATKLFYWFAEFLEEQDAQGYVIVDSRKGLDIHLLEAYNNSKEQTQRRTREESLLADVAKIRLNSITFSEKNTLTGGLELVDLISFAFFHRFDIERKLKDYMKIGLNNISLAVIKECNSDYLDVLDPEKYKRLFNKKTG